MVCTYGEYLKQPKAITFEKMQIFHAEMLAEIGADTEALELYDELMKVATRYAAIRANWLLLSREEKSEQDSGRTSCHNSVITHFNMLVGNVFDQFLPLAGILPFTEMFFYFNKIRFG